MHLNEVLQINQNEFLTKWKRSPDVSDMAHNVRAGGKHPESHPAIPVMFTVRRATPETGVTLSKDPTVMDTSHSMETNICHSADDLQPVCAGTSLFACVHSGHHESLCSCLGWNAADEH